MAARDFLRHHWHAITIVVTAAAFVAAAVAIVHSLPPRRIVMATGAEGGTYHVVGQRYRSALAREGIDVELRPTAGSVDNLALLRNPDSGVSVALLQGGSISADAASGLESLGALFYEPMWWFHRREVEGVGLAGLIGRKISIGPEGSGTRALALEIIRRAGLEQQVGALLPLAPQASADKLLSGEIDVAFIMAARESRVVQELVGDERIALAGYPRADALVALYPFLNKVIVPRGALDLAKDRPPADVELVATKASLVIRADLHPAIQYLLLNAAREIHSGANIFHRANEFPAAEAIDVPLSSEALRFYKSGLPFLHDFFPFWMAELMGKLIILLIPILGVLYPLMRFLPRLYDWVMRSKVLRMYGELRLLEDEVSSAGAAAADTSEMIARLDRLEAQANRLRVPLAYASMLYMLRTHIDLVRERLAKPRAGDAAEGAAGSVTVISSKLMQEDETRSAKTYRAAQRGN
jgi:TRAP transporter TAXI family solute receptor